MRRGGATNPPGCSKHTHTPGPPPASPHGLVLSTRVQGGVGLGVGSFGFFSARKKPKKHSNSTPHTPYTHLSLPCATSGTPAAARNTPATLHMLLRAPPDRRLGAVYYSPTSWGAWGRCAQTPLFSDFFGSNRRCAAVKKLSAPTTKKSRIGRLGKFAGGAHESGCRCGV